MKVFYAICLLACGAGGILIPVIQSPGLPMLGSFLIVFMCFVGFATTLENDGEQKS